MAPRARTHRLRPVRRHRRPRQAHGAARLLPAWPRKACCPTKWTLVGNGRGDVGHEDFRKHVQRRADRVRREARRRGRGPSSSRAAATSPAAASTPTIRAACSTCSTRPASSSAATRSSCTTSPCRRSAFAELTKALGEHGLAKGARVVYEKPFGTSRQGLPRARRARALGARRGAGLPHRPLPGQGGHPGPARAALRQRPVRRDVEPRARPRRADRRARAARRHRPRGVLRRHRRRARHAGHAPVPGRGRGRDGAAGEPAPPTTCRPPARRSSAASARSTRTRSCSASSRATATSRASRKRLEHRHLRRRPAVDRQRPLARRAVPAAHRQAAGARATSGSA